MGKENSAPKFDSENPEKSEHAAANSVGATGSSGGEITLDIGGQGAAAKKPEDRTSIGPYVLVRKLGEGGMGQVWLAEQTTPVKRQVALKLIKGGLYDSAVIQRFESERQSLAVMNHPAIAKVFDAGATKDGQPYFVMEFVGGPPISRYCDNKKLNIRERLELFIKVCDGVQHAHQKAIIHRDLKPSNILVVEVDGKATPRIIDFGVAKAISPQAGAEQTQFTEMGALVGTRGFMSPEQADPNVLDVDTRTDVYSLGVVLYVLLTGMLPFDSDGGKKKPIDEMLRQLREEDPPSPSTKVNTEKETATAAAERRGTDTKQLGKLLQGDLDCITMKSVERDRTRRYGTPSELAADVERYLANGPVMARPANAGYRLKKYVQRHRLAVAAVSGAALLLVAFAITQAVQLRQTRRERDRANRITQFMKNMFKVSNPSVSRGNSITAREILDSSSKNIDTELAKDPELQAELTDVMGNVYMTLGLYSQAQPLLTRSVEIRRRVLGPKNPDTLISIDDLCLLLLRQGHYSEADKMLREALVVDRRVLGPEHETTLRALVIFAGTLDAEGHYAEAEKLQRETIEIRRRTLGTENDLTALSMNDLAATLSREGHYAESERLFREALDIQRRVLGPENPETLITMYNLAATLATEGRYADAEKLDRQTLEIRRRVLGPEHPDTLMTVANLAATLQSAGNYAEAEKFARETLEIRRRVLGPEHPRTLWSMSGLAEILDQEGHLTEAEKMYRETLDIRRRVLGPENPDTLASMDDLGRLLSREGQYTEAEKMLRETLETSRRVLGPDDTETASAKYNLACVAVHYGNRQEALTLLSDAVDHGLDPASDLNIEKDSDLQALQGDPRFVTIVADAKQRAAAAQKPN
jgi:serine/threonine protein kinase/Tfp pilus assembly protein PilF